VACVRSSYSSWQQLLGFADDQAGQIVGISSIMRESTITAGKRAKKKQKKAKKQGVAHQARRARKNRSGFGGLTGSLGLTPPDHSTSPKHNTTARTESV